MEPLDVNEEYAALVEQARRASGTGDRSADERRRNPRFSVQTDDLWISTVPEFAPLDLSATGMAFASEVPLQVGEQIEICLGGALKARAEVIACELVDSPTQYLSAEFRINCRFIFEEGGKELLVRVKRLERMQHDAAGWLRN